MAAGLRAAIDRHGLAWSVAQAGSHAYYFFAREPPRDGATSRAADDPDLRALIRVFAANRGVWESGWWLGPTVSVAHSEADVDAYLDVIGEFLAAVAGSAGLYPGRVYWSVCRPRQRAPQPGISATRTRS